MSAVHFMVGPFMPQTKTIEIAERALDNLESLCITWLDPNNGWQPVFLHNVQVVTVTGEHITVITDDNDEGKFVPIKYASTINRQMNDCPACRPVCNSNAHWPLVNDQGYRICTVCGGRRG